jgi:putative oxidoreductase
MINWLDTHGRTWAMLLLRLYLGAFLIWGVWDNITDSARMTEFAGFLASLKCPWPTLAAPVSVWAQFLTGLLLIAGLWTRTAGALLAVNFLVAVVLFAGTGADMRVQYPHTILVFIGLVFVAFGAGAVSVDAWLRKRKA